MTLKMFVWEGVFADYTSGMACVLANDLQEAIACLKKKYPDEARHIKDDGKIIEDYDSENGEYPKIIEKPEAFIVWGGG